MTIFHPFQFKCKQFFSLLNYLINSLNLWPRKWNSTKQLFDRRLDSRAEPWITSFQRSRRLVRTVRGLQVGAMHFSWGHDLHNLSAVAELTTTAQPIYQFPVNTRALEGAEAFIRVPTGACINRFIATKNFLFFCKMQKHAKSFLSCKILKEKNRALGIEPWTFLLVRHLQLRIEGWHTFVPFNQAASGARELRLALTSAHQPTSRWRWDSEQSETFITGFNVLARGASPSSHFDINSVNAPDQPLGPSVHKHAAVPSIVGTCTNSGKILLNSPRGAWWRGCESEGNVKWKKKKGREHFAN